jgi:hypothetical protein
MTATAQVLLMMMLVLLPVLTTPLSSAARSSQVLPAAAWMLLACRQSLQFISTLHMQVALRNKMCFASLPLMAP